MLTVDRPKLSTALSAFKNLVRKSPIPIIECVLMSGENNQLTIEGTNLDHTMQINLSCDGTLPRIAVNYERAERFLGRAGGADCSLAWADNRLSLRSGRARAEIPTLDESGWPQIVGPEDGAEEFSLSAQTIERMVRFCGDVVDANEPREYIRGICLCRDAKGAATAVSTDGSSLAALPVDVPNFKACKIHASPIMPVSALSLVSADDEDEIAVRLNEERVTLSWPGGTVHSKLIAGIFPDWQRAVAVKPIASLVCSLNDLSAASARVMAGSGDRFIGFVAEAGTLKMRSHGGGAEADCEDEIDAEITADPQGRAFVFGLAGHYLLTALRALDDKSNSRLTVVFAGPGLPIRLSTPSSDAYRVIMPVAPRFLPKSAEQAVAA
jgi:DNA polymerase III subunit beta